MPRRRQLIGSNACQVRGTGFTVAKDTQEGNLGLGPLGIRGQWSFIVFSWQRRPRGSALRLQESPLWVLSIRSTVFTLEKEY